MKYRVTFTTIASRDMVEIWDYHESESSKSKADRLIDKILKLADSLESLPNRYRSFEHEDYRCVPSGVYLLVYRVSEDDGIVFIETVFDNRQDPMKLMDRLK